MKYHQRSTPCTSSIRPAPQQWSIIFILSAGLNHLLLYFVYQQETAGPEDYGIPANTLDPSISWKDVYWLQSITRLPIIIKGILTKEDAELAVEHGVQGIIVSNHGGRQLDGGPASVLTDHITLYFIFKNCPVQSYLFTAWGLML